MPSSLHWPHLGESRPHQCMGSLSRYSLSWNLSPPSASYDAAIWVCARSEPTLLQQGHCPSKTIQLKAPISHCSASNTIHLYARSPRNEIGWIDIPRAAVQDGAVRFELEHKPKQEGKLPRTSPTRHRPAHSYQTTVPYPAPCSSATPWMDRHRRRANHRPSGTACDRSPPCRRWTSRRGWP